MRVRKIYFNHDHESADHDAINLFQAGGHVSLSDAEWSDGMCRKAVAYALSEIRPPVRIKVVFSNGPRNSSVEIRADVGTIPTPTLGSHLLPNSDHAMGGESPLGPVTPTLVKFDEAGNSAPILFDVKWRVDRAAVGKFIHAWSWLAQTPSTGAWRPFATTVNNINIIYALPKPPWTQNPVDPDGWSLPWDSAIDKACEWAAGATSIDDCILGIARAINENPQQRYSVVGSLVHLPNAFDPSPPSFFLGEYLDRLTKRAVFDMNCRDVASALITFANVLGAYLRPLSTSTGFTTNQIRALTENAFGTQSWGFHEVTARNQSLPIGFVEDVNLATGPDELVRIYDACLHLAGDVEPYDMPFGSVLNRTDYRFALIDGTTGDGTPSRVRPQRHVI